MTGAGWPAAVALVAALGLSIGGCGGGGLYPFTGTGALDLENSEVSTHWIDVMELTLDDVDDTDPFWEWGYDYDVSYHNRDPNESERFTGLTPGWWTVVIWWSDGRHTVYHDVHIHTGRSTNLEVLY